jgi:galactokinase
VQRGVQVPPLKMYVRSNLALGSGLSSQRRTGSGHPARAAHPAGSELDGVTLAQIAQQAEIQYAGVNCGIMDQMAASLADTQPHAVPRRPHARCAAAAAAADAEIIVIDPACRASWPPASTTNAAPNAKPPRATLGVQALRDVARLSDVESLPSPMRERARHVVTAKTCGCWRRPTAARRARNASVS